MKKILCLCMIFVFTFCFIGNVDGAGYRLGTWQTASCGKTTDVDYADVVIDLQDAFDNYSLNSTTGSIDNAGNQYSSLSAEEQNSGVFYNAPTTTGNQSLTAYLIKVSDETFQSYGVSNLEDNDYCVVNTTSEFGYDITTNEEAPLHGTYQIKVDGIVADYAQAGSVVSVVANPDDYYETNIKITKTSNDEDITNAIFNTETMSFTMPAYDVKVEVDFTKINYTISQAITNGSVTLPDTATYGDEVVINPVANENYLLEDGNLKILNHEGDDITSLVNYNSSVHSFVMPGENVTVKIDFEKQNYLLNKQDTTNGSFVLKVDDEEVDNTKYGNTVKLDITPNDYYEIDNIIILDASNNSIELNETDMTFIMPKSDVTVNVTFKAIHYDLEDASKNYIEKGSISFPSDAIYGETVNITITNVDAGYELDNIYIYRLGTMATPEGTGNINSEVNYDPETHSFTMIGEPLEIAAVFKIKSYNLTKEVILGSRVDNTLATITTKVGDVETTTPKYKDDVDITINLTDSNKYKCKNNNLCYSSVKILKTSDNTDVTNEVNYQSTPNTGSFVMPNYDVIIVLNIEVYLVNIVKLETTNGTFDVPDKAIAETDAGIHCFPNSGYVLKKVEILDTFKRPLNINYDVDAETFEVPNEWKSIYIRVTFAKIPGATNVTAKLYGYNDINVTWNKVSGADGYKIYYKTSTASNYTGPIETTSTSFKRANYIDGKKYYFKIVPFVKDISGNPISNSYRTVSIYTLKKLNMPTVTKYSSKQVRVKWTKISGTTGYQISRSTKKTGTYVVKTVSNSYSSYRIYPKYKNKKYYYKVRAYKIVDGNKIYGPWSNVKAYTLR